MFWFLHFYRLPCELQNARALYKIKRKFAFFSVNTKYISSSELKTSRFSLVLRTRENSDVFNSLDEIYLVFTSKKQISSIIYRPHFIHFYTSKLLSHTPAFQQALSPAFQQALSAWFCKSPTSLPLYKHVAIYSFYCRFPAQY